MSHRVTVYVDADLSAEATECQSICDRASESLHQIDDAISYLHTNASKFTGGDVAVYENELKQNRKSIENSLLSFSNSMEQYKKEKVRMEQYEVYSRVQSIFNEAHNLESLVNELTGTKLDVLYSMVNNQLFDNMDKYHQELLDSLKGKTITVSSNNIEKLKNIDDTILREAVYKELMSSDTISFDEALRIAQKKIDEATSTILAKNKDTLLNKMKSELIKHHVSTDIIDNLANSNEVLTKEKMDEVHKQVNDGIKSELNRKKAISMIIGAIKKQGFIFDPKNGIKLDKEKDIVKIAVRRPDGKLCTFEVYTSGKFMYHFGGYDGMSCTKDENPFLEALENVYGMKIKHKDIQWENPDRLQNRKMQAMSSNTNHNKG